MAQRERRGFERVEYGHEAGERPVFLSGGGTYEVVDCAERGLRYVPPGGRLPEIGSDVRGTIRFPDGPEVPVEGVVVRAGGHITDAGLKELTGMDKLEWLDKEVIERERRRMRGPGHFAR